MGKNNQLVLDLGPNSFLSFINEELKSAEVHVSPLLKIYLSELLQFYCLSDHLFAHVDSSGKKQMLTLAELYLSCNNNEATKKISLKRMGDMSLCLSGFFRECLKRKALSPAYYISMGKAAYSVLASLHNKSLFEELEKKFLDVAFVFFRIHKKCSTSTNEYLVSLLDQYLDTGSKPSYKELIKQGINISNHKKKVIH